MLSYDIVTTSYAMAATARHTTAILETLFLTLKNRQTKKVMTKLSVKTTDDNVYKFNTNKNPAIKIEICRGAVSAEPIEGTMAMIR